VTNGANERPEESSGTEQEIEKLRERALRLQADFANYRRRTARHFAEMEENVKAKVIASLLPLVDAIEAAVETVPAEQEETLRGLEMLRSQARALLAEHGVERIDHTGVAVEPDIHEVVRTEPAEEERGTVVAIDQVGYRMAHKVLRPAKVAVADPGDGQQTEPTP